MKIKWLLGFLIFFLLGCAKIQTADQNVDDLGIKGFDISQKQTILKIIDSELKQPEQRMALPFNDIHANRSESNGTILFFGIKNNESEILNYSLNMRSLSLKEGLLEPIFLYTDASFALPVNGKRYHEFKMIFRDRGLFVSEIKIAYANGTTYSQKLLKVYVD